MSTEKLIIQEILRGVETGEQSVECATLEIQSVINSCRRDQFAMAAMQGDWSCDNNSSFLYASGGDYESAADQYYRMADAMMREREK